MEASSFVWVVDEASETVSRRPVEIQSMTSFGVLIGSGLQTGERVVVAGVNFLSEGQEIRVVDVEEGGAEQ